MSLSNPVQEISGIADSKVNPGFVWGEEDSGNPTSIYLIGHDGHVAKSVFLKGITNRDWEEMSLSNGAIFLAETGDNNQAYGSYAFYRFAEPAYAVDTVSQIETISFTYPDGNHDSEAFLVDPVKKDIYIISKRDNPSRIYKLSYPYASTSLVSYEGNLSFTGVVSAAVSNNGEEILLKTYGSVHYYKRSSDQSVTDMLKGASVKLPYTVEPQGEAICFAGDNSGFYTLSEQIGAVAPRLYFYPRNK